MDRLYDIHCHLLPGVDDGSQSMEETVDAIHAEYKEGIRKIIFTPHFCCDKGMCSARQLRDTFEEVKARIGQERYGSKMKFALGQELMYSDQLTASIRDGEALTMAGGQYVLIEFQPTDSCQRIYEGLRSVVSVGYCPILAHIERYESIRFRDDMLHELADMGCYFQVNAGSLFGNMLNKRAAWLKKIIKDGGIHFIATDSHGTHYRKPEIRKAVYWILDHCSQEVANQILYENPKAVWEDKII